MKLQVTKADYVRLSDEELIHRYAQRKDQVAVTILFERYGHLVFGICLKHLKSAEAAKDATQQLFIKLLDDLFKYKIDNFKPWLYRTTKNHCLMQLRKPVPASSTPLEEDLWVSFDDEVFQKIEEEHLYTQLEAHVSQLSKEQRVCIELFYMQKKSYAEIMASTKYSLKEIKSYLQNGKRNLRVKMQARGEVRK